jgi:adenylylsulfate kinase
MNLGKANVLWFTGLSGSGKTTIAESLRDELTANNKKVLILDGDSIRSTISRKLSFSEEDIKTNNLTVADLVIQNQNDFDVIIVPIISPFRSHRELVRSIIKENFSEIYIKCSIDECIKRDTKGLYQKSLNGEIKDMIGIAESNPYESPLNAELVINTINLSIEESVGLVLKFLK